MASLINLKSKIPKKKRIFSGMKRVRITKKHPINLTNCGKRTAETSSLGLKSNVFSKQNQIQIYICDNNKYEIYQ